MSSQRGDGPVVVVFKSTRAGVYELRCRQCDLSLYVRLETDTPTAYEEMASAFLEEHAHDDDATSNTLHLS
jgi:hypothetical protein